MKTDNSFLVDENIFILSEKNSFEITNVKQMNIQSLQKYLSRNSGYNKVTQDNQVLKKIILTGFGKEFPKDGDVVFVNYFAELEDGKSVDNTLILREPKQIIIGNNNLIPGLELGVRSMVIGEKAKIVVFPEYGYSLHDDLTKLAKEDPKIKIDIQENLILKDIEYPSLEDIKKLETKDLKKFLPIIYDIELVNIDKPRKNREYADVTEKITESSDLKNEGNKLFREKRFREALIKYNSGLNYFFKIPTENLKTNTLIDLKQTLLLNVINCHIALNEYNYALKKIPEAFEIKETPKCFFYRALSLMNLGDFDQAFSDIEKLKSLLPNDKQILKLENDFEILKKKTQTEKKIIFKKGLFQSINNNSDDMSEKSKKICILPPFDRKNFCFYLDYVINNNKKIPQKIKFEIFELFSKNNNNGQENINLLNYLKKMITEKIFQDKNLEILNILDNDDSFIYRIDQLKYNVSEDSIDILGFLNFDYSKKQNIYPPCQDNLLAIRKNDENGYDLIILPFMISYDIVPNLYVIGRIFYNNEYFKILSNKIKEGEKYEVKIIDCGISNIL